ncbi:hypothetical protein SeMB42_g06599 [Synchytrium endobioticum]|uniref:Swi5-domain-containing protein n=1 Tax=Synchytrium endobioticum TaxID=286115 RepID=A0A507CL67_9FUNG|nr:hypothetical protein SeMB42_g06599 [Synchytrium endobioticum]TPX41890.1 hypothetical protein SeLEV6574_g05871 [Synchytrium endobioticum]
MAWTRPIVLQSVLASSSSSSELEAIIQQLVQDGILIKKDVAIKTSDAAEAPTTILYARPGSDNTISSVKTQQIKNNLIQDITTLQSRVADLSAENAELDNFIGSRSDDVDPSLAEHIMMLHRYNEIKDIGQMILGKLAEMESTTTKGMYARFGLDEED